MVVAGLFASEATEQGCTVFEPGSRSCSAVWVTVGQGSAFWATGWSSSHRASSMSEWALRALLALSTALRDSFCEPWLFPGTGVSE